MYFITFFKQILKKNSFYTKYRQYKFSKLVKVVTRAKANFSINRWLHLYFSLKLHNIQNEHFLVLKKCKKCFKFNGNVLFCHYGSILDSDKSCNPGRKWSIVLNQFTLNQMITHSVSVKIHIVLKYYIFTSNFARIKKQYIL